MFEVGAEDAFEGEGAALAEGTVVLESASAGRVDRRDVVPDAREVPAAGGVEELPVTVAFGGPQGQPGEEQVVQCPQVAQGGLVFGPSQLTQLGMPGKYV